MNVKFCPPDMFLMTYISFRKSQSVGHKFDRKNLVLAEIVPTHLKQKLQSTLKMGLVFRQLIPKCSLDSSAYP